MEVARLDHLVLTVRDVHATVEFYGRVLGMDEVVFGEGRRALHFGQQKINLHPVENNPVPLVAAAPVPGSADLCLIMKTPLEEVAEHLEACDVEIIEGPIERTGAAGPILSLYFRDPDGNLIEVSNPV